MRSVLLILLAFIIVLPCGLCKLSIIDYMVSGAVATSVTDFVLYPIDTIKVTQQNSKQMTTFNQALNLAYSKKGFDGFFNGALGYAMLDGCSAAIFFATYEKTRELFASSFSGAALGLAAYPSAAIAFIASTIFLVPAELVKTRMQTSHYESFWSCVRDSTLPHRGGIRGLYLGYIAILVRDLPYFSLQLGCYDNAKNLLHALALSPTLTKRGMILSTAQIELCASVIAGVIVSCVLLFISYRFSLLARILHRLFLSRADGSADKSYGRGNDASDITETRSSPGGEIRPGVPTYRWQRQR